MNTGKLPFNISARQQGDIALLVWAVVAALLLRHDVYGLDEQASRSLFLTWSIADQVASSVTILGMPDLRILPYLPVGFLWTGSVFAAKVLTVALLALSARLLFVWKSRVAGNESALLATGLLLISPIALAQIDGISTGVYLLASFALGAWADVQYRANPRPFNGWFFTQLFICAFSVSLHPVGLAYPLALIWSWRTLPQSPKYQRFFLAGTVFVVIFILLLRNGWGDWTWYLNPVKTLGTVFTGSSLDEAEPLLQWLPGIVLLGLAGTVTLARFREIWTDLTGRTLLLALVVGLFVGDQAWALVVLCFVLYFGIPMLLRQDQAPREGGFFKQRGLVLLAIFVCSTVFMRADKAFYEAGQRGERSAQDELIKTLAVTVEAEREAAKADEGEKKHPRLIIASEWPGRTMIACKCDTLPLPPAEREPQTQLERLRGITYLLFDPKHTANVDLVRNFSVLGGAVETVSLQPGGVLLRVRDGAATTPEGNAKK